MQLLLLVLLFPRLSTMFRYHQHYRDRYHCYNIIVATIATVAAGYITVL